jgi:hypothetical protein
MKSHASSLSITPAPQYSRKTKFRDVDQEGVEPSSGNKAINNLYRFGADLSIRISTIRFKSGNFLEGL